MFKTPTVFILGAGASWHYSYPTGENLIQDVVKETTHIIKIIEEGLNRSTALAVIQNSEYVQDKAKELGSVSDAYNSFLTECKNLVSRLKQVNPPVIDYFLGENEDLTKIGKLMIAWVILSFEQKQWNRGKHGGNTNENRRRIHTDSPYYTEQNTTINIKKFKDDWYRFIIYRLTLGCKDIHDFVNHNNVSFITFNYDVSLERTLYESLKSITILQNSDITLLENFFKSDRFLHIYGPIRKDSLQQPKIIKYDRNSHDLNNLGWLLEGLNEAYISSKEIRTIYPHEKNTNQVEISAAIKKIKNAQDVFILGYGFDENNSQLLNLYDHLNIEKNDNKRVFFTNYEDHQSVNKRASRILFGESGRFHPTDPFTIKSFNKLSQAEKSIRDVYTAIEKDFDFSDLDGKS